MPATTRRRRAPGPVSVRFGAHERALLKTTEAHARTEKRSVSGQIKYYAELGMIAKDNLDLSLSMSEGILEAREEFRAGPTKPYEWGVSG